MTKKLLLSAIFFLQVASFSFQASADPTCIDDKRPKISILPSLEAKANNTDLLTLSYLLKEALEVSDTYQILFDPAPPSKNEGDISISLKKNKEGLALSATHPKGQELLKTTFTTQADLKTFLLETSETLSKGTKLKLSSKKVLPYLHLTSSWESLGNYAMGSLALEKGNLDEAIGLFKKSIEKDYNHDYAYVKLALSLALKDDPTSQRLARIELQKARLLNPVHAKLYEKRIEDALKGKKPKCL